MKTKFTLIIYFFILCDTQAQQLNNTYWLGTNAPSPNLWAHFSNDTLSFSSGTGYQPTSLYIDNYPNFSLFDIVAGLCPDTGYYTYSISGSNLQLTALNDVCSTRQNTLENYTWTQINTSVNEISDNVEIFQFSRENVYIKLGNYSATIGALDYVTETHRWGTTQHYGSVSPVPRRNVQITSGKVFPSGAACASSVPGSARHRASVGSFPAGSAVRYRRAWFAGNVHAKCPSSVLLQRGRDNVLPTQRERCPARLS